MNEWWWQPYLTKPIPWSWTTTDSTTNPTAPQLSGNSRWLPSGLPARRTKRIYGADVQARRDYR